MSHDRPLTIWQTTPAQTSLQDFARDPSLAKHLVKHHCRTSLAIHPWPNIIAGLCSRSTLGQTSLQDVARDPPLTKPHCRTSPAIHLWSIIFAQSTFDHLAIHFCSILVVQLSLSDPAIQLRLSCHRSIYPRPIGNLPEYPSYSELRPLTLSISPIN